jgi:hypothetical protein
MKMPHNIFANIRNFVSQYSFNELILATILQICPLYILNLIRGYLTQNFLFYKYFHCLYVAVLLHFFSFLNFCKFSCNKLVFYHFSLRV